MQANRKAIDESSWTKLQIKFIEISQALQDTVQEVVSSKNYRLL